MAEDGKLILEGIITVVSCLILTIISIILIEKKLPTKKAKWLSYLAMFLLGVVLLLIWPFPSKGEPFYITTPTLIGASFAVFTFFTFIVVSFINSDIKMAQTMIADAILMGKSINLNTQGIPEDKKTPFHQLYFYYTGLINNTWFVSHFEKEEEIRSTKTIAEQKSNPNYQRYKRYLVYKIKLNHNTETTIKIVSKASENDYGILQMGYQKLKPLFSDLNEHIVIYYKSGEENMLSKLENPLFRKLLIDHKDYFDIGFDLNTEKGIGNLKVRYFYPSTKMFEFKLKEKFFNHSVEERKAQLKFLAEFLSMFDK